MCDYEVVEEEYEDDYIEAKDIIPMGFFCFEFEDIVFDIQNNYMIYSCPFFEYEYENCRCSLYGDKIDNFQKKCFINKN